MEAPPIVPTVSICQVESNLPGEDRYCIRVTEDICTYGVYDGHGGYLAADIACAILQDMIISDISATPLNERTNTKIASIIDAAFITCDDRIIKEALALHEATKDVVEGFCLSRNNSEKSFSKSAEGSSITEASLICKQQNIPRVMGRAGSCAAVVVITGGMMFVAHVG